MYEFGVLFLHFISEGAALFFGSKTEEKKEKEKMSMEKMMRSR